MCCDEKSCYEKKISVISDIGMGNPTVGKLLNRNLANGAFSHET